MQTWNSAELLPKQEDSKQIHKGDEITDVQVILSEFGYSFKMVVGVGSRYFG